VNIYNNLPQIDSANADKSTCSCTHYADALAVAITFRLGYAIFDYSKRRYSIVSIFPALQSSEFQSDMATVRRFPLPPTCLPN